VKDLYFIDGYNVIFRLYEHTTSDELEAGRKKLVDALMDFGAHANVEIIVVFDGQSAGLKPKVEIVSNFFTVVYTPSRMTADSYIEKESYRRRGEYRTIFVVTSDGAEQTQALGNGAYRMPVPELARMLADDKAVQERFIQTNNVSNRRGEIAEHVPEEIREKLNRLRGLKGIRDKG